MGDIRELIIAVALVVVGLVVAPLILNQLPLVAEWPRVVRAGLSILLAFGMAWLCVMLMHLVMKKRHRSDHDS